MWVFSAALLGAGLLGPPSALQLRGERPAAIEQAHGAAPRPRPANPQAAQPETILGQVPALSPERSAAKFRFGFLEFEDPDAVAG
jgi:hypothetical protein